MSKNSILLSKQVRADLKELLQLLNLKKTAIATLLNMAESTFSEATGINGKRRISNSVWQQLQEFIVAEIRLQDEKQILDNIKHNRINILLNKVFDTEQKLKSPSQNGPIASKEHNYIQRDSDDLLERRLQNSCRYFWINGGIKKGKTSLLNKISEFCKDNKTTWHLCDLNKLINNGKPTTLLTNQNILQYILETTTQSDEKLVNNDFDELCEEFRIKFIDWSKNGTLTTDQYFITIDHIDNLFDPILNNEQPQYDTINIIQFILQTFLNLSRELDNVRFAIVVEDYLYTSAQVSPLISQAARIALKPFTAEEIVKLWELCKPQNAVFNIGLEQALSIINKISGNPYLVQHLFYDIYHSTLPNKPLNAYLKHISDALGKNSKLNLQSYTLFREQLINLIKKIALQTQLNNNTKSLTYEELVSQLRDLERSFIDPTIHSSLKRLDIIEEGQNRLHPIIEQILAE